MQIVSPERGYRDWLHEALGVNWMHLPFAAFPRVTPTGERGPAQSRLCVIGTVGTELGGSPLGETLRALLDRTLQAWTGPAQRGILADALSADDAHAMPALTLARELGWAPEEVLVADRLPALIALDSWVKRDRRLRAVRSLTGVPVDFFGSGWQQQLGEVPGFRHVGEVHHDDIALLMANYAAVVNFDPNWAHGVHDRVYTAVAMGVPVVTNHNLGLGDAQLPDELVVNYDANLPAIADLLDPALLAGAPQRDQAVRADVLARHNWGTRMAQWIGDSVTADQPSASNTAIRSPQPESASIAPAMMVV